MSTALAVDLAVDQAARPLPVRPAPPVRVAPAPTAAPAAAPRAVARPKVLAAAVVLTGVVCVVAAQLVLSIGTADGAYRLAALQQQSDSVSRQAEVQQEALASLAAPQRLAARAAALGMVQADSSAYLDARTGKVLGSTKPVVGDVATPSGIVR